MAKINGKQAECGMSVAEYLCREGYVPARVAVERNGEIVPRSKYDETLIKEDDVIEVVAFVGGG